VSRNLEVGVRYGVRCDIIDRARVCLALLIMWLLLFVPYFVSCRDLHQQQGSRQDKVNEKERKEKKSKKQRLGEQQQKPRQRPRDGEKRGSKEKINGLVMPQKWRGGD